MIITLIASNYLIYKKIIYKNTHSYMSQWLEWLAIPAKSYCCLSHSDDLDAKIGSEKQNPLIIETHTVMIMLHLQQQKVTPSTAHEKHFSNWFFEGSKALS